MTWAGEEVGSREWAPAVVGVGEGDGCLIPRLEGVGGQVLGQHRGGELVEVPLLVAWPGCFAWGSRPGEGK